MRDKILFVCIGQGGSNLGQIFEDNRYNCLFVNSSYSDLVPINAKHKLHIVGAEGCNKDRKKALEYIKEYYGMIENTINTKFPMQSIVYFVFSMGGGTGSGVSPLLLDYFVKKYPNKHYGAIAILPSKSEGLKTQMNAIECYNELSNIAHLISVDMLDNSNVRLSDKNYSVFNKMFYLRFDKLINMTLPDSRGIVDGAELETTLTCKGNRYIELIPKIEGTEKTKVKIANTIMEKLGRGNPYTAFENKKCKYITMTLANESIDEEDLQTCVGIPLDTFRGYNEQINVIALSGQSMPKKSILELFENVKRINSDLKLLDGTIQKNENMTVDGTEIELLFDNKKSEVAFTVKLGEGIKKEKDNINEIIELEEFSKNEVMNLESQDADVMSIFNKYAKE